MNLFPLKSPIQPLSLKQARFVFQLEGLYLVKTAGLGKTLKKDDKKYGEINRGGKLKRIGLLRGFALTFERSFNVVTHQHSSLVPRIYFSLSATSGNGNSYGSWEWNLP